jgi:signal transduction histidine kinase/ActR/RegA family two-component response regulator
MTNTQEKPHDQLLSELRQELASSQAALLTGQKDLLASKLKLQNGVRDLVVKQQELLSAQSDATTLRAELAAPQAILQAAQDELSFSLTTLQAAQAELASSQDRLEFAKIELTRLRAANHDALEAGQSERLGRAEAERLGRIKDEFLANLSHEIRTPLNAILGWSQMLKPGQTSDAELTEGLEVITRNARTQARLIDDLLDMSRIISGKMRLDVQRVDLPAVIDAAIESVKPAAEAKGIKLQKVVDPIAGPITGDPNRLQQVIWNLLINAIKFTPKLGKVQIVVERVNSHIELSVSDTGKGIASEFLPHVFERFSQADSSSKRGYAGLGLGLAIVKSLAELHGGSVRAKSGGEGKGTTFIISLPISVVHTLDTNENLQHAKIDPHEILLHTADLKGITVLVVDDEPDAIGLVKRIMEDCGATVESCMSAAECLASVPTFMPDVVIMDIGMPDMDGYTLIGKIRTLSPQQGGRTPAVALTAFARSEDRRQAMLAGFDLHVAKPVEPGELVAVVSRLARRN